MFQLYDTQQTRAHTDIQQKRTSLQAKLSNEASVNKLSFTFYEKGYPNIFQFYR